MSEPMRVSSGFLHPSGVRDLSRRIPEVSRVAPTSGYCLAALRVDGVCQGAADCLSTVGALVVRLRVSWLRKQLKAVSIISPMRCSFCKMSAASWAGGRCVMSSSVRGFLRSRLQPAVRARRRGHAGRLILGTAGPPCHKRGELLELDGRRLGVVLPALGQRLLVIPDLARRAGAVEEQDVRRDAVYGANTPLGSRTMVWRLNSLSSSSLMRAHTPSPNSVPFGTTTAAAHIGRGGSPSRPRGASRQRPYLSNFRMMSCKKSRAVSAVCLSSGKLP